MGLNLAWISGPLDRRSTRPRQISPHRYNVSTLRGEKPQNRPLSNLYTGACAARNAAGNEYNYLVINCKYNYISQVIKSRVLVTVVVTVIKLQILITT